MIRSEKGVSAVEFALIAPLLFVLTFGIVEFGLLLFDQAVITNASREGARAAIVFHQDGDGVYTPPLPEEIEGVVADYTESYLVNLGGDNSLVPPIIEYGDTPHGPSWGPYPPASGDYVRVTVNYTYDFLVFPDLTKLLGGSFDGSKDLVGRTIMRME
jgi:hypothetical protein